MTTTKESAEVKHTPTPWEVMPCNDPIWGEIAGPRSCPQFGRERVARVLSEADAAFIVEAVNSYARDKETIRELVEALRRFGDHVGFCGYAKEVKCSCGYLKALSRAEEK